MKLILTEDVPNLGPIGQIVSVRNGYARNYLLPRSLAVLANESNTKELAHRQRVLTTRRSKLLAERQAVAAKMEKLALQVTKAVGEEDRIFGTVTTAEVAELLEKAGLPAHKKDITFAEDIKKIGSYVAHVRLHSEVVAAVKIQVVAEPAA